MADTKKPNALEPVTVTVAFQPPEGVPGRYASHVLIQMTGHEYVLSFFEMKIPLTLGDDATQLDELRQRGTVHADCVGRIIMAPERFYEALRAINEYVVKKIEDKSAEPTQQQNRAARRAKARGGPK
jgi:hypothetical protein